MRVAAAWKVEIREDSGSDIWDGGGRRERRVNKGYLGGSQGKYSNSQSTISRYAIFQGD